MRNSIHRPENLLYRSSAKCCLHHLSQSACQTRNNHLLGENVSNAYQQSSLDFVGNKLRSIQAFARLDSCELTEQ